MSSEERRKKTRPCCGGISISLLDNHSSENMGTLGGWFKDKESGMPVLLSTCDVLASNLEETRVIQQGSLDGGKEPEVIANRIRYIPINKYPSHERNYLNAAIAQPLTEDIIDVSILGIDNPPNTIGEIRKGDKVKICTVNGIKEGVITAKGIHANIGTIILGQNYIKYENQFFIETPMPHGRRFTQGDKGALVFNQDNQLLGMVFDAISINNTDKENAAVATPITTIFKHLNIDFL